MSDDRHLSGEEKRAKLKEEYKKELEARRAFLDRVEEKRKTAGAEKALADLLGLTEANPLLGDDTDSWIEKLKTSAATAEAKIDMMLERFGGEAGVATPPAAPAAPSAEAPTASADPRPAAKTLGDLSTPADGPAPADPTPPADAAAPKPRKTLGDNES